MAIVVAADNGGESATADELRVLVPENWGFPQVKALLKALNEKEGIWAEL